MDWTYSVTISRQPGCLVLVFSLLSTISFSPHFLKHLGSNTEQMVSRSPCSSLLWCSFQDDDEPHKFPKSIYLIGMYYLYNQWLHNWPLALCKSVDIRYKFKFWRLLLCLYFAHIMCSKYLLENSRRMFFSIFTPPLGSQLPNSESHNNGGKNCTTGVLQ